jgi:hypothetical protein
MERFDGAARYAFRERVRAMIRRAVVIDELFRGGGGLKPANDAARFVGFRVNGAAHVVFEYVCVFHFVLHGCVYTGVCTHRKVFV